MKIITLVRTSTLLLLVICLSGQADSVPSKDKGGANHSAANTRYPGKLTGVRAGDGKSPDLINVTWQDPYGCKKYMVSRSTLRAGAYIELAQTKVPYFADSSAQPGVKYWYRIQGYRGEGYTALSDPEDGYRSMPLPDGLNIDEVISRKNNSPTYRNDEERKTAERHERVLRPYYKHPLKLNLIILVAKYYVRRGDLKILGDFYRYYTNDKTGSFFLIGKNSSYTYTVTLENSRFVRIARNWSKDLLDRLMQNALLYCIYSGDRELRDRNGMVYMVPHFNAVGFTSEYYRNDRNWKNRTVMFDSDNEELDAMIRRAGQWKKGN